MDLIVYPVVLIKTERPDGPLPAGPGDFLLFLSGLVALGQSAARRGEWECVVLLEEAVKEYVVEILY